MWSFEIFLTNVNCTLASHELCNIVTDFSKLTDIFCIHSWLYHLYEKCVKYNLILLQHYDKRYYYKEHVAEDRKTHAG